MQLTLFGGFLLGEWAGDGPQRDTGLARERDRTGSSGRLHNLGGMVVQVGICTADIQWNTSVRIPLKMEL